MYRKLLSKSFFANNPYKEVSAARIVCFTLLNDGIEELVSQYAEEGISAERMEKIQSEKGMIANETDPQALLKYLRSDIDVMNRPALVRRALEYEDEILPAVTQRLVTSGNDHFIENAVRLLAKSQEDYTAPLVEQYAEIRDPHTQSMVCVVLGKRGEEKIIPWMYERYMESKRLYPEESYSEGPLLALYELKARFYGKS